MSRNSSLPNLGASSPRRAVGGAKRLALGLLAATVLLAPSLASAHTVRICTRTVDGVTTFYAGTYHDPSEGPSPIGSTTPAPKWATLRQHI